MRRKLVWKQSGERDILGDVEADGRIMLRRVLGKWCINMYLLAYFNVLVPSQLYRLLIIHRWVWGLLWVMNWKGCGRKRSWRIVRCCTNTCLEVRRKNMKYLSRDSRSAGQDSNSRHPKIEARRPATEPRHSVWRRGTAYRGSDWGVMLEY